MILVHCPFEKGRDYRIIRSISEFGHEFAEGEVVRFSEHAYEPKLGVTRFWFKNIESNEVKAWHLWDSEEEALNHWREIFEPKEL